MTDVIHIHFVKIRVFMTSKAAFTQYRIAFRSGAKKHLSDAECTTSEAERNNISPLK
jgi:hypothetical protein